MKRLWRWLRRTRLREVERKVADIEQALRDLPGYIARAIKDTAGAEASKVQANLDRLDANVTRHVRQLERDVAALRVGVARTR